MWSYSVERLVVITLHAASLLHGACRAHFHPHLQAVAPEVLGIFVILSQPFLSCSFLYAFSKFRSWDFQVAFPSSFLSAQGWSLRAVVTKQHPCGCWLHTLPWHSNPVSRFQVQTCKFAMNFCCFTAFPHIRSSALPTQLFSTHVDMHKCVGNTQETSLPAFEPLSRLLFLQHCPPCLSLIFLRAVVQVILPTYLWSFSKGADELPGTSESTVSLLRAAALFLRSSEKSLLSWVSNWELR